MKPRIEELPCFNQVAGVIGRAQARIELFKAVGWNKWFEENQGDYVNVGYCSLLRAFVWDQTPQKFDFWFSIDCGLTPTQEEDE